MRIKKELPQFSGTSALIIVTGTYAARLYTAREGNLTQLKKFTVPARGYTDREGHFRTRHKNMPIRSGAVYESKEEARFRQMVDTLKKEVVQAYKKQKPDLVYVFTPPHIKRQVPEAWPAYIQKHIVGRFTGNYLKSAPYRLLSMIQEKKSSRTKKVVPAKKEAKKLLKKKQIKK